MVQGVEDEEEVGEEEGKERNVQWDVLCRDCYVAFWS